LPGAFEGVDDLAPFVPDPQRVTRVRALAGRKTGERDLHLAPLGVGVHDPVEVDPEVVLVGVAEPASHRPVAIGAEARVAPAPAERDRPLALVVSDMLYRAFPNADEGELSKRLADLVRKESCADVAKSLGLLDDIKLGAVGAGAGARLRKSVLGDVCEAVIGAIFLDGGYAAAAGFVERNWTERMHKPRRPLRDPKTVLQEWAQGKGLPTPVYREVERTGPHHDPQFRVAVDLPGLEPAEGVGGSKRAAEKVAASVMIEREGVSGGSNDG